MPAPATDPGLWLDPAACRLEDLVTLVEAGRADSDYPLAARLRSGIPHYDGPQLRAAAAEASRRAELQGEIARALLEGPGVAIVTAAYEDLEVVDRSGALYRSLIEHERRVGGSRGDHFAVAGANDRLWDALSKLAAADGELFVDFFGVDAVALVCEAWLGPGYQLTAQVNVVNPGGAAQSPHRDYHLGFFQATLAGCYPAPMHAACQLLTLQAGIAHCDMPVETGPTMFLPHSQKYPAGYLAVSLPEFKQYALEQRVQLPLERGDIVFFNPAVLHGAGANRSGDVSRMATLLQVSSAFGRSMESIDRRAVSEAVFPALVARRQAGTPDRLLQNAVAAAAEGYPFPVNLDRLPPVDALAPPSQQDLLWRAVCEQWSPQRVAAELDRHAAERAGWPPGPLPR